MKRIKYILCSILVASLFVSCNFLQEEDTYLIIKNNYFKSVEEVDAAIYPIYNYIFKDNGRLSGLSSRAWGLNCGADDITSNRGTNKQRLLEFDDFEVSSENDDLAKVWKALYRGIGAANNLLANKEIIDQIPMDNDLRNARYGEVYFLRALAYYNLVCYWGEVPIVLNTMSGDQSKSVSRSTIEDVYEQIIADVQIAEAFLPAIQVDKGRPTLDAARTLLSYVYLNMAGWPLNKGNEYYKLAADKSKQIIDDANYQLETNFATLWSYDDRISEREHIFAFYTDFSGDRNSGSFGNKCFRGKEEGGWTEVLVEKEFANNFPADNRRTVSIYDTIKFDKKGLLLPEDKWIPWEKSIAQHPYIGKFRDIGGANWSEAVSNTVYPIFRFADVLLVFAEASNMTTASPSALAVDALARVQARAYNGTGLEANIVSAGISKADFDATVLKERSWEFAFEMKRWNDLVRREKVKEANANHTDERDDFDVNSIGVDDYLFPIPARELLINPNL